MTPLCFQTNLVISICDTFKFKEAHAKYRHRGKEPITSFGGGGQGRHYRRIEFWARLWKMSWDCQMNHRETGSGVVGKGMEGNKIFNKGKGQFMMGLWGTWPELQLETSFWLPVWQIWVQGLGTIRYLFKLGADKLLPSKFGLATVFINTVLLEHSHTYLFMCLCGFHVTWVELSSSNPDCMAHKVREMYYLSLYSKSCQFKECKI